MALLPSTHVSVHWRGAALGDPSLWSTISLSQTPPPLLDVVLARARNQLFTIHADHPDLGHHVKLWILVDRIEELHYSASLQHMAPFLASLGPAPNLKVLHLRPESFMRILDAQMLSSTIPTIFSGVLPSLRDVVLKETLVWPAGLFRNLTSFNCGDHSYFPISPAHVFDAILGSPLIEFLSVVGRCGPIQGPAIPPITLSSLKECTLAGEGTASLIRFIAVPATALVFLCRPYVSDWTTFLAEFSEHCVVPGLRTLGEVSALSFFIDDYAARLRARNDRGGGLDVEVDGLVDLTVDPLHFVHFMRSSFESWCTCPELKTAKDFTFFMERSITREDGKASYSALDIIRLISNLPGIEEAKLYGVPPLKLSPIFGFVPSGPTFRLQFPNLKRLDIVSFPLRSPRPLLVALGKLLATRKEAGAAFQSVTVRVKCKMLIPVAEHCAFLASLEGFVGGGVRLEYVQAELLSRCYLWKDDENEDEDRGDEEGEEEGGEVGGPGDCVGWDGWPENWPKTTEEMKG